MNREPCRKACHALARALGNQRPPKGGPLGGNKCPGVSARHQNRAGVSTVAENQIAQWLKEGGEDALGNKGKKLVVDRHRDASAGMAVNQHDVVHSKILADNNIRPESIERRLEMDRDWEKLKARIRDAWEEHRGKTTRHGDNNDDQARLSIHEFSESETARELFSEDVKRLDLQAKRVNEAAISDSLRFNGRSPVRHAKPFVLEDRIVMALEEDDDDDDDDDDN